jgi:glycosyltransferase involved in cell wall biosynthesis
MSKTICFFNTAVPWGGGEKWHFEMAKHLHENGHKVVIFCHNYSVLSKKAVESNIPFEAFKNRNTTFLNPLALYRVKKLLQRHDVGTLILNLSKDVKTGGFVGKWAGVERIIYRRGSAIPVKNSVLNRFLFSQIIDEILVNSKATKHCILENNPNLFPTDYITIIPNGIDGNGFIEKAHQPYYTRKGNELILTNLGRLEEQKNQLFLIDVAHELKKRKVDFHLIIGGSGRLEESIKAKITALEVESFVSLVGFVKNPKDLYMSGDVFLLPSLWEGFGYVIAEAGLSKKPTIAFDISSNPEVIVHNKTGLLTPKHDLNAFCDAILHIDSNRERITKMGLAAQKHILTTFNKHYIHKKLASYLATPDAPKISALITTHNEEKNIEKCIRSVSWADEIIVIDSFSSDNTVSICEKLGVNVLQRKYNYAADQKNWAIPQATHPWIVLLDADETADSGLEEEVRNILKTRPKFTAYWIYRKNYFLGKEVRFCGWQNDRVVRFFHRDLHRYQDKMVHEEITASSPFGTLKSKITHHTTTNLERYTQKIEHYAHYAAQEFIRKDKRITAFDLYVKPAFKFLNSYIFRGGILDGKIGWIICKLRTRETWLKAKIASEHKNDG